MLKISTPRRVVCVNGKRFLYLGFFFLQYIQIFISRIFSEYESAVFE